MIGLQELIIERKIKITNLARELGIKPERIWDWIKKNKIPNKNLKMLAEKLGVEEEYLNKQVNDIVTYKPKNNGFNNFEIREDVTIIHITRKNGIKLEAIVDTEEYYNKLKDFKVSWYSVWDDDVQNYYVRCTLRDGKKLNGKTKYKMLYLHRYIMDAKKEDYVDHKSHNTLDNRKNNLIVTTDYGNVINRKGANKNNKTTGIRNITYIEKENAYWVQFMRKGERFRWVFNSDQFDEACEFAKKKRKEIFGELLHTNIQ